MEKLTSIFPFLFREYYRTKSSDANRIASPRDQNAEASNQVPSTTRISNEINPPEVVANREAINQNKLRRNKKQHKALKLSGNVDLGSDVFKQTKQGRRRNGTRKATKTKPTQTTPHPNTIPEVFQSNHHRHNHNDVSRQEQQQQRKESKRPPTTTRPAASTTTTSTTAYPRTYPPAPTPRARIIESTSTRAPSAVYTTELSTKALDKVKTLDDFNLVCS